MLSGADYEKVLEFSNAINRDYSGFPFNVRSGLSALFDFQLTAYTIINVNRNDELYVEEVESAFLPADLLRSYREGSFRTDLFQERLSWKKTANTFKHIYTIEDISTSEEFFSTDYGKQLAGIGIRHQAVLKEPPSHPFPRHAVSIYRTQDEPDFSAYELELLGRLGRIFIESCLRYKAHMRISSVMPMIDWYSDSIGIGLAVLDSHNRVAYHNSSFVRLAAGLSKKRDVGDIARELIRLTCEQNRVSFDHMTGPLLLHQSGCEIDVRKGSFLHGHSLEKNIFVTLRAGEKNSTGSHNDFNLSEQYNFTAREMEIVSYMIRGYSNAQIAESLFINISTVKFHMRNVFAKLGVSTRSAAVYKIMTYTQSL